MDIALDLVAIGDKEDGGVFSGALGDGGGGAQGTRPAPAAGGVDLGAVHAKLQELSGAVLQMQGLVNATNEHHLSDLRAMKAQLDLVNEQHCDEIRSLTAQVQAMAEITSTVCTTVAERGGPAAGSAGTSAEEALAAGHIGLLSSLLSPLRAAGAAAGAAAGVKTAAQVAAEEADNARMPV